MWRTSVVLAVVFGVTGCVAVVADSPRVARQIKIASAGHTGCLPDDNDISNVNLSGDGNGTWNATCKGKVFLCSAAGAPGSVAESYSCAPVAN
jgi:hypothetical protein